jgi:RNA polymerase sigma-70 factor (ECF subfamily)
MEGIAGVPAMTRSSESFESAVAPHYSGLVRRLTAVLRDHEAGQDLAQKAYLRAFRARSRFDGTDSRAWLHTIGLRLAFNERDRRRRWGSLVGRTSPLEAWVTPEDRTIHEALGELRPVQRAALLLNAVDGYTQAEIAAMLDVPPGTVASWLSRAKAQLRETLRND